MVDFYSHKESAFFFFYDSIHFFIHSYPGGVSEFPFVTKLAEKLHKILHGFFPKCWCYPIGIKLKN
ncbi:hypothetical protein COJ48_30540 [Bacillus cereus]|nr:hypothetical protein COJ48_30540 [Bacillus cereus]PGP75225.1 hypothetical protein CN997_25955 [Bacillus cereus]